MALHHQAAGLPLALLLLPLLAGSIYGARVGSTLPSPSSLSQSDCEPFEASANRMCVSSFPCNAELREDPLSLMADRTNDGTLYRSI